MSRVFVLGSGFSASMGLPTQRDLFPGIIGEQPAEEEDREQILYALEMLYPHFKRSDEHAQLPPFEEFLSLVQASQGFGMFNEGYWEAKWRSALRLLTDFLGRLSARAESASLLHAFVAKLTPEDVVITFNWDTLIERALVLADRPFSFIERSAECITILKLHGSLNWFRVPDVLKPKVPEATRDLGRGVRCTLDFVYYDLWDALDLAPHIVPPTFLKNIANDPFLMRTWHEAFNSLVSASSLAFIGYSFPREDLQARSLLTLGCRIGQRSRPCTVIDPVAAVGSRYEELLGGVVDFREARFSAEVLERFL